MTHLAINGHDAPVAPRVTRELLTAVMARVAAPVWGSATRSLNRLQAVGRPTSCSGLPLAAMTAITAHIGQS